jgi:hypothetical protein
MKQAKFYLIKNIFLGFLLFIGASLKAENSVIISPIQNFTVKENLLNNNGLAIITTDSSGNPNEKIKGNFLFVINGFKQSLDFNDGVAFCKLQLQKSSFLYIKHENGKSNPANLYFVYQSDSGLNPFKISWYLLLAIPIGLILIGYMFKKIIGIVLVLLAAYMYFNHSNGLSIGTFFESIIYGLKSLI